jgi:hypothetical protein
MRSFVWRSVSSTFVDCDNDAHFRLQRTLSIATHSSITTHFCVAINKCAANDKVCRNQHVQLQHSLVGCCMHLCVEKRFQHICRLRHRSVSMSTNVLQSTKCVAINKSVCDTLCRLQHICPSRHTLLIATQFVVCAIRRLQDI